MADVNPFPDAADMATNSSRLGMRFQVAKLVRAIREAAGQGNRSCTLEGEFIQRISDLLQEKGYQVAHDGTTYTLTW